MTGRSADYVQQPGGFKAFFPATLPPNPPVQIDSKMQEALSRADRALGRLYGSIQTLPDPDIFVFMYVREEAVLSTQIEGTQSSLEDVLEAESAIADPRRPRDVGEVCCRNFGPWRRHEGSLSQRRARRSDPVL